jgi:hypothetical protein
MLHIGKRSFIPVPAQCGIHLQVDPIGPAHSRQVWRIDAAFVPADEDEGTAPWSGHELWRLHVAPILGISLKDWREWEQVVLGYESDQGFLLNANLENLCAQGAERGKLREACVEECRIIGRDGYGFVMEAEGEVFAPEGQTVEDGVTGDFRLRMEIPFASVNVSVPVNAADPLSAARAIAEREIGLKGVARSLVTRFDPERAKGPFAGHFNKHSVWLETPWRKNG